MNLLQTRNFLSKIIVSLIKLKGLYCIQEKKSQEGYTLCYSIFIAIALFTFLFSCNFPAVTSAHICIFPIHTVHIGPQDTIGESPFLQSLPLDGLHEILI